MDGARDASTPALLAGVLAGPLAWLANLQVSYMLVPRVCHGAPPAVLHLVALAALVVTMCAGVLAVRSWLRLPPTPAGGATTRGRMRFLALLGLGSSVVFAVVIVAGAIPAFVVDPCQ